MVVVVGPGGGANLPPGDFLCSSETVTHRRLKLCDF